jgi:hypothetical protein
MFIGALSAIASLIYILRINSHRNKIKSIEETLAERRLCASCIKGDMKPGPCPIPDEHRPETCPYFVKTKLLAKLKAVTEDFISEETPKI